MTIVLMISLAFGQAELSVDMAESAETAIALIDNCQDEGLACGASREQLGDAFVVRATAAAVLRGELDHQGAANARALVPVRAKQLDSVLPSDAGLIPSPWLAEWGVSVGHETEVASPPLQHAIRAGLAGGTVYGNRLIRLEWGGRFQLSRNVGGFVAASAEWMRFPARQEPLVLPSHTANGGMLVAGVGPRRRLKQRRVELFPVALGVLTTDGYTGSALRRLGENLVTPLTGGTGVGGGAGLWATKQLSNHIELGGFASVMAVKRFRRQRFWNPQRTPLVDVNRPDADAADRVVVRLNPEARVSLSEHVLGVVGLDVQHNVWFAGDSWTSTALTGTVGLEVGM